MIREKDDREEMLYQDESPDFMKEMRAEEKKKRRESAKLWYLSVATLAMYIA